MNRLAGQKQIHRCTEQTYGHQGGKVEGEGGGGMNWETGIDIYTLICIKQITNKNLLHKKIKFNLKKKNVDCLSTVFGDFTPSGYFYQVSHLLINDSNIFGIVLN